MAATNDPGEPAPEGSPGSGGGDDPLHPAPPAPPGRAPRPIRLVLADPGLGRSRLTVALRLLLAIPHLIWFSVWSLFAILVGAVAWLVVLVTARLPESLQDFYRAYVRYTTHLHAYLSFAADRYPGFVGREGYAVDVEFDPTPRLDRRKAAFRLLLALPALLVGSTLAGSAPFPSTGGSGAGIELALHGGGAASVVGLLGWFVCLVRGRMSPGLRDLAAYAIGYGAQVTGYLFFLTDRYPSAHPSHCVLPPLRLPRHPVRLANGGELRRARLLVLLRLPLCFPHLVWLTLWTALVLALAPVAWLLLLALGRLPGPLHRFLAAWVRAGAQLAAFATLVAGPFPGFVGAVGYPVDVTTGPPDRQRRLVTLARLLLAVPALLVASAYGGALALVAVLLWACGLVLGRVPEGLQALGAAAVRYGAQAVAYAFLVTDRYPYASPALEEDTPGASLLRLPGELGPPASAPA